MARVSGLVLACAALYAAIGMLPPHHAFEGLGSYLPLHSFLETLSIVIAALIFGVMWNAYSGERAGGMVALGCAFLAVSLIDFAHALSYAGMPAFVTPASPEKAIYFWLAARLVAALALAVVALAPAAPLRSPRARYALLAAAAGVAAAVYGVGLFRLEALPRTFIEGQGLTGAKVAAEWAIILLLALPAVVFYRQARRGSTERALLFGATAISMLSELAFTRYAAVDDAFNLLGHVYKLIAYLLIYRAVFVASVRAPFDQLAEREARLAQAQRIAGLASTDWDMRANRLSASDEFFAILGLRREAFDGTPESLFAHVHPEDREAVVDAVQARRRGASSNSIDCRILRPDGAVRYVHVEDRLVLDEAGRPARTIGFVQDVTDRKLADLALAGTERRFRSLVEHASDLLLVVDQAGTVKYASPSLERILGYRADEVLGRRIGDFVHPEDAAAAAAGLRAIAQQDGRILTASQRYRHRDGRWLALESVSKNALADPLIGGIVINGRDVTERRAQQRRIERLTRVHAVLSGINAAIVRIRDRVELLQEACRIAVEAGGFIMAWAGSVDRAAGLVVPVGWWGDDVRGFLDVAPLAILDTGPGGQGLAGLAVREARPVVSNDVARDPQRLMKKECAERGINSLAVLPLVVEGNTTGVLALYAGEAGVFDDEEMRLLRELAGDVAFALDHIEKEERVRYLAYYDSLTGLANRTLFLERLAQHLAAADREGRRLALVILNIERFKTINDTLGRPAGDALLKQFGERLQRAARDAALVARVGADQFAALLLDARSDENLMSRLERGDAEVKATPFPVGGQELRIATRAGVAVYPQDAADAESLFRNAEAALKQAQTGEMYVFYKKEMTARVAEKLVLENELRQALEKSEFVLHYQPKLDLATRRITGVEALIRWASPQRGLVAPMEFIPLLEETGLIVPVGAWAMARAVADHARWQRQGLRGVRIAVNVSAMQLRQREFVSSVRDALKDGAPAAGIDLEITESLIMEDVAANIQKLKAVRELGVNISIDDFGTGYSSLGYLAKLPVQSLKIDRSFIVAMAEDADTMTLVSTIVSLGHALRLSVIAEGVDSEDQAKYLRLLRCDEAQGYLYSKPLPAAQLEALLRAQT